MKDFIKDIPGWAKGIMILVVLVLIAWIIYKFYDTVGFKSREEKELEKDLRNDKNELLNKGQKPTFSRTQYNSFAEIIDGENKSWNTDEDKIYNIFRQFKNDLDVILLSEAFGKKRPMYELIDRDLTGFLNADLNKSEIGEINKIFASKNIKFRF
jgi:hypothetical protein